jgi:hypothetical protein
MKEPAKLFPDPAQIVSHVCQPGVAVMKGGANVGILQ